MTAQNNQQKGRRWMLVINNPSFKESETIYELAHDPHVFGMMWSAEHADDENKTEHYHIYISFNNPVRFHWIKQKLPRADIELAKKPALACCRYVAKEGFYMSFGNIPDIKTGCKKDSERNKERLQELAREEVVKKIRNGEMRFQDLSDEQLLDRKLVQAAKEASSMTQGPYRHGVHVCCFVSPSGWGKSFAVWDTFKRVAGCEFTSEQTWFLDAEQEVMLFDEFAGLQNQCRAQKMLRFLDEYPISLPVKGGHRPCYWKAVFICSNTPPEEWYMMTDKNGNRVSSIPEDVRDALYRRIGFGKWEGVDPNRETHVYTTPFTDLNHARKEMLDICIRIHDQIFPPEEQEPQSQPEKQVQVLVGETQADKDDEEAELDAQEVRRLAALHGVDVDAEEARWERAREIQREREEHEYDDMPALEPNEPEHDEHPNSQVVGVEEPSDVPSAQDPMADVPTIEYEEISDDDEMQDPPHDSDDSDFEN